MPRVQWDMEGTRFFETGIDRGMLYLSSSPGVAWSGLMKVSEAPSGGAAREFFIDGEKYLSLSALSEYAATVESVSSPGEFAPCAGLRQLSPGLLVTNQPRKPFGFSYRSLIGSDIQEPGGDYKIHVVYNVLAKNADHVRQTESQRPNLKPYSMSVSAVPEPVAKSRPTAHFIVDTRKIDQYTLAALEDILYGNQWDEPRLPTSDELLFLLDVGVSVVTGDVSMKKMGIAAEVNSYECGVSGGAKLKKMRVAVVAKGTTKVTAGPKMKKMKIAGTGAGITAASGTTRLKKMRVSAAVTGLTAGSGGSKLKKFQTSGAAGAWNIAFRGGKILSGTTAITSYQLPLTGWDTANPATGDILFCTVRHASVGAQTWGQSAGSTWTKIFDNEGEAKDGAYSYAIWYRVMQAGDTAPTFTWTSSNSYVILCAAAFKPFTGSTPLIYTAEVSAKVNAGADGAGVNSVDPAAATAAAAGRTSVVVLVGRSANLMGLGTPTFTPPAGWTAAEYGEVCPSGTAARIAGFAYRGGCQSGSIDPGSLSWTDSVGSDFAFSVVNILIRTGP